MASSFRNTTCTRNTAIARATTTVDATDTNTRKTPKRQNLNVVWQALLHCAKCDVVL